MPYWLLLKLAADHSIVGGNLVFGKIHNSVDVEREWRRRATGSYTGHLELHSRLANML
jgi:hypothetical protein